MTVVDRTRFLNFFRTLPAGRRCRVVVADATSGETVVIYESRTLLLEAPNWTRDDQLVLNGHGRLWTLPAVPGAVPTVVPLEGIPALNNDHVLALDGDAIYLSANDWHIYVAPLAGGAARRVTLEDGRMHFLHGIRPDGARLAYTAILPGAGKLWEQPGTIRTVGVDGADDGAVTTGPKTADGSEFSSDGEWILLNTEAFTTDPGHAQIARVRPDGDGLQRLTRDDRVNWFPHVAPDGRRTVYLSYPPGTIGHPADLDVELRLVQDDDWAGAETLIALTGGQGTINVNSWSPDSTRFAYVDYPADDAPAEVQFTAER